MIILNTKKLNFEFKMKHEIPTIRYTKLSDMSEPGEYNCYGIIYDASFPQIQEQSVQGASKYECTIKFHV